MKRSVWIVLGITVLLLPLRAALAPVAPRATARVVTASAPARTDTVVIRLWHSFRDREKTALQTVVTAYNLEHDDQILLERFDDHNFTANVDRAIQSGRGPDLFIWAHDKIGDWAERGLVAHLDDLADSSIRAEYLPNCLAAMQYRGHLYGLPLAFETLILYTNLNLVPIAPISTDEMVAIGRRITDRRRGVYGLVYERGNFYHHGIWLHGFGGRVLDADGNFDAFSAPLRRSIEFARNLGLDTAGHQGIVPDSADWEFQMKIFNEGRAGMLISGPWAYGEIDRRRVPLGMAILPHITEADNWAAPYLGVKGVYISARSPHRSGAMKAAAYLTSGYAEAVLNIMAGYLPANRHSYENSVVAADTLTLVFKEQTLNSVPMPSSPAMQYIWKVMMTDAVTKRHGCLDRVFLDREPVESALRWALVEYQRLQGAQRPTADVRTTP